MVVVVAVVVALALPYSADGGQLLAPTLARMLIRRGVSESEREGESRQADSLIDWELWRGQMSSSGAAR